jgi:hypothetical protein
MRHFSANMQCFGQGGNAKAATPKPRAMCGQMRISIAHKQIYTYMPANILRTVYRAILPNVKIGFVALYCIFMPVCMIRHYCREMEACTRRPTKTLGEQSSIRL